MYSINYLYLSRQVRMCHVWLLHPISDLCAAAAAAGVAITPPQPANSISLRNTESRASLRKHNYRALLHAAMEPGQVIIVYGNVHRITSTRRFGPAMPLGTCRVVGAFLGVMGVWSRNQAATVGTRGISGVMVGGLGD